MSKNNKKIFAPSMTMGEGRVIGKIEPKIVINNPNNARDEIINNVRYTKVGWLMTNIHYLEDSIADDLSPTGQIIGTEG